MLIFLWQSGSSFIIPRIHRVRKTLKQVADRKIKADNTSEIALTAFYPTSFDSVDVQAVGCKKNGGVTSERAGGGWGAEGLKLETIKDVAAISLLSVVITIFLFTPSRRARQPWRHLNSTLCFSLSLALSFLLGFSAYICYCYTTHKISFLFCFVNFVIL